MNYVKIETINLKNHPELTEAWVQEKIADDPQILGLGEVELKGRERLQPGAGRLDLLFQDASDSHRYEVEIQLGSTDPSHIVRTIEYWDRERKRYPQYKHTAVLITEDVTGRFLNVISLFNGHIPFIAMQMRGIRTDKGVGLLFTRVLDEFELGLVDDDEEGAEPTNRDYWVARASNRTVELADKLLALVHEFDPKQSLKYNKHYIGLAIDGRPNNFAIFRPKKNFVRLEFKLPRTAETDGEIEKAGLEVLEYDARWGAYKVRVTNEDISTNRDVIVRLMQSAYEQWTAS